jgi:hypothetical protein
LVVYMRKIIGITNVADLAQKLEMTVSGVGYAV